MLQDNPNQLENNGFESIQRLLNNIERLKQAYLRLKEENNKLFEEKQQLLEQLNQKEQHITELKKQIETLKVTNALILSATDTENTNTENLQEIKHSAKLKLNKIIKEIDTAIKLLSTYELQ